MPPGFASTRPLAFLFAIAAFLIQTTPAQAALVLEVENATALAGSSNNSFDVVLENTGPSSVTIAGFSFALTSSSRVTYTDVTTATALPYIFNGNSDFAPDIVISAGAGAVSAGDNYATPNAGFTLAADTTVALGHVLFNIGAGGAASIPVDISPASDDTELTSPAGAPITITTLEDGTIMVTTVPEPSSLVLATGVLGVFGLVLKRRRASAA